MTARLALITSHPIKSHGREDLASVRLLAGEALPWDRFWAVAHEAAKLRDGWSPCVNFSRGARAPALMAITCQFNEQTRSITLHHPAQASLTFRPDAAEDLPGFLAWVTPLNPPERAQPQRITSAGRGMTDSDWPSVSILSLSSLAELSSRIGIDLSPHRFRGNLWIEGWAPWVEWNFLGRSLQIGDAVLEVRERITRCKATTVDVATGQPAGDTLASLQTLYGHQDFGLYAEVITPGDIALGQEVTVL